MKTFDVIVVGVGGMGSAVCAQLSTRGASVLGLEQFDIPHSLGSSHGSSRVFRMCYHEDPGYVPLLKRAYESWMQLDAKVEQTIFNPLGGVFIGSSTSRFIDGICTSARRYDLPHEELDHGQLAARFPQFRLPSGYHGVIDKMAGYLCPERAITAMAEEARSLGAELKKREPVIRWSANKDGVQVQSSRGTYQAAKVVFCGGAWTTQLLSDLGIELVVTRQVMGWVSPIRPERFTPDALPVWAVEDDEGTIFYGFPVLDDRLGFKLARDVPGEVVDPDTIDRNANRNDEAEFRVCLEQFLPDANGPLLSMSVCMYTNSPDHNFIIGRHPRHENVLIACGFSGHGFKFCPVIGEILADLAEHDATQLPIEFLTPNRFGI